jgi:hypothetical protein
MNIQRNIQHILTRRAACTVLALMTFIALCAMAATAHAQQANDEVFKVVACKGKVSLHGTKKALAVGAGLTAADQLKLEGKCYLGLVHRSGRAVECRTEGLVKVADLLRQIPPSTTSLDKLVGFVVQTMTNADKRPTSDMSGGVERSITLERVQLLMPRTTKLLDSSVAFIWSGGGKTVGGAKPKYEFSLSDAGRNVRFKRELADTAFTLNMAELSLERGQCYYWSVVQTNAADSFKSAPLVESYCIYPLKADEAAEIQTQATELRSQQSTPPTDLDELMTVMFYEQQGLNTRAFQGYRTLLKRPEGEVFRPSYQQFLRRIGMDANAQSLLK